MLGMERLEKAIKKHADAASQLKAWLAFVEAAEWDSPHDVGSGYSHASFLSDGRIIFRIKGNKYRLVALVDYPLKIVSVQWFDTHAKYDRRDWSTR